MRLHNITEKHHSRCPCPFDSFSQREKKGFIGKRKFEIVWQQQRQKRRESKIERKGWKLLTNDCCMRTIEICFHFQLLPSVCETRFAHRRKTLQLAVPTNNRLKAVERVLEEREKKRRQ